MLVSFLRPHERLSKPFCRSAARRIVGLGLLYRTRQQLPNRYPRDYGKYNVLAAIGVMLSEVYDKEESWIKKFCIKGGSRHVNRKLYSAVSLFRNELVVSTLLFIMNCGTKFKLNQYLFIPVSLHFSCTVLTNSIFIECLPSHSFQFITYVQLSCIDVLVACARRQYWCLGRRSWENSFHACIG